MPEPEEEQQPQPNALMRYGRALVWRIVCELVRRYPAALTIREQRIHTGQMRGISLRNVQVGRELFFHVPTPEGSMGMVGYLEPDEAHGPLGQFAWQQTIGEMSRAGDPRWVLNDLGNQLKLGPRKGIPPTKAHTICWRVVAEFMTQVITGRTGWDLISGVCFDAHYGDTDRDDLVKAYPEAEEAARTLSASADPRSEMWFFAEDRTGYAGLEEISKATACIVPRTGHIWRPEQPSMDLMAVYQESSRRLWPTLGAALGDLLG